MPVPRPLPIRQRRNTVGANVSSRSPVRPQPVRQRRNTVAVQVNFQQNIARIQKRRESVAVGNQVEMPEQRLESVAVQTVEPIAAPPNPEIWCVCRGPEEGEMIFCENPLCVIQWFHFDCLDMEEAPEGAWYCPNCSKIMNKK